jgi:transposase
MEVFIGVDFHTRSQTVCWSNTADGEVCIRKLDHSEDDVKAFYQQFPAPAVVGLESSGYALWFHQLLDELGHQVKVGDAYAIRQFARRKQKNDRRNAELLLDLLMHGDFPAVHVPCPESRDILGLLRYRHRLVQMTVNLKNGLHAVALKHQVRLRSQLFSRVGLERLEGLPLTGAFALQREQSLPLLKTLNGQIGLIERELRSRARNDVRVQRLRTQPGVGLLTSLTMVHTLEPAGRFTRSRQVAAYCGLDPKENSSGELQRYGGISKQGNRLLRTLLVEASYSAVRPGKDEELRRFYYRLLAKKNSSIAIVAVARKLAVQLFTMLRDEIDYNEFRRRGRAVRYARWEQSPAAKLD